MSLICLLSFNGLQKQHQAIILTVLIACSVIVWFIWVIVLSLCNTPPLKLKSSTTTTMLLERLIDLEKNE